jgi:nucleotide-binding universal stress UspA family protein
MIRMSGGRVVAGGEPSCALAAADVAAAEAAARDALLHLVICAPDGTGRPAGDGGLAPAKAGPAATNIARRICTAWPGLRVTVSLDRGDPAARLIEESRGASLVVVGARRPTPGTPASDPVGDPVATAVAAHALCPVVVVPPATFARADRPVLLGVCATPGEEALIAFAFAEAARRRVPLHVTHVWAGMPPAALSTVDPFDYDLNTAAAQIDRLLAETLAGWTAAHPQVTVVRQARYGVDPGKELVHASAEAGLVVVGAHCPGTTSAMALGTVTRELLVHAHCPVGVIR